MKLGVPGFSYADLHDPGRLADLAREFDRQLEAQDARLFSEFTQYRESKGQGMSPVVISDVLVRTAPYVGAFISRLFNIEDVRKRQIATIRQEIETVFRYRQEIVAQLDPAFRPEQITGWDIPALSNALQALAKIVASEALWNVDREKAVSTAAVSILRLNEQVSPAAAIEPGCHGRAEEEIQRLREALATHECVGVAFEHALACADPREFIHELLELIRRWSYAAKHVASLQAQVKGWLSFKAPQKTDFDDLVPHVHSSRERYHVWQAQKEQSRRRDGFSLTDKRFNERQALYEVEHCIYCHQRDTDSCSKGMRNKRTGDFKINPLGVAITGCPLGEKISEMHVLKRQGDNIGALALVMIDNPMCPGTGHRICNDCMKGCIYQKTEPVNIPQIETHVLTEVLFMPYGFEIYSLLARWNPLHVLRPHALPYNGKNVLVVGLGPAGYTLAHYLLNEGFGVVGIDGLKIEPLPAGLTGSKDSPPQPIRDFSELYEDLDKRITVGFGGVAEYGITVRWDKNFLKVIYLTLARSPSFRAYGGVRFGGTLTVEEAWDLGFHHIAIAAGAGKPTIIGLKNNLLRGIRKASDFLMALQLTGAAKESSLANLQVRLPAGVIGGGLTAIDTSTELMAYYPRQVEKILHRYQRLLEQIGEQAGWGRFDEEERVILAEFLAHGRAIQGERERAQAAAEAPDFKPLLERWGGVTLFYRKEIKDAPAYRQNHEEIREAMAEGIVLAEGMNPLEAIADDCGHLKEVVFEKQVQEAGKWVDAETLNVPLRSLFIAAGTSPNTIYQSEHPGTFEMDGKFYRRHEVSAGNDSLIPVQDTPWPKIGKPAPLTSYCRDGKYISFYGDNHPVYAGNVVKAMASAKDGFPYIVKLFEGELKALEPARQAEREQALSRLQSRLDEELIARVVAVNRLTPTIIEVIVRAPMQARKFSPGQFYRVQNLETLAPTIEGTVLASEGLALTGAWVDRDKGLISLIALEMGSSSRLCAFWQRGDPVVVMGVTGTPTEIPHGKTVLLAGGGLGNAVLFSIGKALRAEGNRVIYFAGYRNRGDVFKASDIEQASDVIVWAVDRAPGVQAIPITRPQDKHCIGNIVEAMVAYAKGELGEIEMSLGAVDHIIAIGSDRMMRAVQQARLRELKPYLKPEHVAIGSINSPMQCMMKGVCAQCLCKHIDPETGKETFVYSCYNQDQHLDHVDFDNLHARLKQNSVQEKLSSLWLDFLLSKPGASKLSAAAG